ncbi:MAG: HAD-IB family phosphatase [Akkermansiaceae bacterium]
MNESSAKAVSIEISMDEQMLELFKAGELVKHYPVSTSEKGMGFAEGSYRTPTGSFEISEKIGEGEPIHTRFVGRKPVEVWDPATPSSGDLILSRILRLRGKESQNENSEDRFIYIHGTNQEGLIGKPSSYGCVRLKNEDMIELFDAVSVGAEVEIKPLTENKGKILFIDCDSTLSSIEGIDELARAGGAEIYDKVVQLTNMAMNGEVPLDEVFKRRMEIISPDMAMVESIGQQYIKCMVPGVEAMLTYARSEGWLPVIISGGFAPIIKPLADRLGIKHIEAVPLYFDREGNYTGYGDNYPTTRNLGKNEIIQDWRRALLPERVIMIGDGVSDLETKPDVDQMIGFGGVVSRDKVKAEADLWLTDFTDKKMYLEIFS